MDEYLKGFDDALGAVPVVSAEYATLEQERDQLKARIAELEQQLRRAEELFQDECDPVSEPDSYTWLLETRALMVSERT